MVLMIIQVSVSDRTHFCFIYLFLQEIDRTSLMCKNRRCLISRIRHFLTLMGMENLGIQFPEILHQDNLTYPDQRLEYPYVEFMSSSQNVKLNVGQEEFNLCKIDYVATFIISNIHIFYSIYIFSNDLKWVFGVGCLYLINFMDFKPSI